MTVRRGWFRAMSDQLQDVGSCPGVWSLRRWKPTPEARWYSSDPVLAGLPCLGDWASRLGIREGQEFLINSDGRVFSEVNAFFGSLRMRNRSAGTREKYGYALCTWLGFLDAVGRRWDEADAEDVEGFKFWRMTDEANPQRVAGGTVSDNLDAVNAFYDWAGARYGVRNPVARIARQRGSSPVGGSFAVAPHVVRERDVKWLDPGGYALWRDVGLRGLDRDGREVARWRGRNSQRDCAFADGLYGTGLRLSEWASVLMLELPAESGGRAYATSRLAAACAKGGRGRRYWMPRTVLADALAYCEGERAAAVRRARREGRYERLGGVMVLRRVLGSRRLELVDAAGVPVRVSLDALTPQVRRRIFLDTPSGPAPAALWLNEDGLPRAARGWQHTFDTANERVARAGLEGVAATAHMLRHSMALRWFSVGRLLYERRFAHLDADELLDFRAQFGDTWQLVQTLLGHADVSTTMDVYLEPFRDLDVSLLIEHAHGAVLAELMAEMFAGHRQVITAPVGAGR
ncbi:site-specific integrase [Streptomyces humidus]|uniref:site-specific integrase n=1 Tax=Streptomyces humidus TaxID=52259 RepID=UPI001E375CB1|nr:site-specific integrase [Streptomyces humidus]